MSHSPGPWVVVEGTNNGWEVRGTLGQPIAIEPWHGGMEHKKYAELYRANATLIAAAPDLLEGLRDATALIEEQRAAIAELTATLEVIERWELPPSGRNWADTGEPMSYGAAFGSNGEREYIRGLARAALSKHAPAQSQEQDEYLRDANEAHERGGPVVRKSPEQRQADFESVSPAVDYDNDCAPD